MTISMIFRGIDFTTQSVAPAFVDPVPLISIAKLNLAKEATVVFFASALFTSFFVAVTVLARHNEVGKMPFLIALPTAIALYFANLLTTVTSGGYNNPVVALIIILQNKKYYFFYPL